MEDGDFPQQVMNMSSCFSASSHSQAAEKCKSTLRCHTMTSEYAIKIKTACNFVYYATTQLIIVRYIFFFLSTFVG